MKTLFTLILISSLSASVLSYFLAPTIYNDNSAKKTVCNSGNTDLSASPTSPNKIPYLKCTNNDMLKVVKAVLVLSTRAMCPLDYTGINQNNIEFTCNSPDQLYNQDATEAVKNLCDGKSECVFSWTMLPQLACSSCMKKNNTYAAPVEKYNYNDEDDDHKYAKSKYMSSELKYNENDDDDVDDDEPVYAKSYPKKEYDDEQYEECKRVLKYVDYIDQALVITYSCQGKRDRFRPFGNKRYSDKFHPNMGNPLRKLSYNRLQLLDGAPRLFPAVMPVPVPPMPPMPSMPPMPPMPQMPNNQAY